MGMDLYIDSMVVSKDEFEKWKTGELCLNNYDFKLISREEYDKAFDEFVNDWIELHPTWEEDYTDITELKDELLYEFSCEQDMFTKDLWDDLEVDYYIEEKIIELDDKIVWVKATYF